MLGVVTCANVGDSRAVLARDGGAVDLSQDHKPDRPDEQARVVAAGGTVTPSSFADCARVRSRRREGREEGAPKHNQKLLTYSTQNKR